MRLVRGLGLLALCTLAACAQSAVAQADAGAAAKPPTSDDAPAPAPGLLAADAAAPSPAAAAPPATCSNPGTLKAKGTATVNSRPDTAKIYVTIEATAPSADAARERAANTTKTVLAAVEDVDGVGRGGMAASSVSVSPVRTPPASSLGGGGQKAESDPAAPPKAFRFQQGFTVTVRDPEGGSGHSQEGSFEAAVSRALDAVVAAGRDAASVSSVAFMLSDEHAAEAEAGAKRAAIANLQKVAAADAAALGVRLGALAAFAPDTWASPRPVAADWATVDDAPPAAPFAKSAAAVSTPIVAGDISTGGEVYGTFYICPE